MSPPEQITKVIHIEVHLTFARSDRSAVTGSRLPRWPPRKKDVRAAIPKGFMQAGVEALVDAMQPLGASAASADVVKVSDHRPRPPQSRRRR